MNEQQKRVLAMIQVIIDGYEAQKKLHVHECDKCFAGAQAFADGKLVQEDLHANVCSQALEYIKKSTQADLVIEAFKRLRAKLDSSVKYSVKPTDELGIEHLL